MTFDPWLLLAVAGTFALAGTVKGVVGMGLPTVSLALLTAMVGDKTFLCQQKNQLCEHV